MIFAKLKYPTRPTQLQLCRWFFAVTYLVIAALLSAILVLSSAEKERWVLNLAIDCILCSFFIFYCKDVSNHEVGTVQYPLPRLT